MTFDINTARVLVTVISFAAFMAVIWYAARPGNRERFDAAARLPLDEGDGR